MENVLWDVGRGRCCCDGLVCDVRVRKSGHTENILFGGLGGICSLFQEHLHTV